MIVANHACSDRCPVDGERQNKTVVVVGMLANQINTPGCRKACGSPANLLRKFSLMTFIC